jgi:hypothetical protein
MQTKIDQTDDSGGQEKNEILETPYIPMEQYRALNRLAGKLNVTTDHVMRDAIDLVIKRGIAIGRDAAKTTPLDDVNKEDIKRVVKSLHEHEDKILGSVFVPSEYDEQLKRWASRADVSADDIICVAFDNFLKTQF